MYKIAADQLHGKHGEECLYIGDGSSHELTGASKLGMQAVLLEAPDNADTIDREEWHGPTITSLKEVLNVLD